MRTLSVTRPIIFKIYHPDCQARLVLAIALVLAWVMLPANSVAGLNARTFEAPIGESKWRVSTSRLRCGLSIIIKDYGVAYFEQYATKDPHFILNSWQREKRQSKAKVWNTPPMWRPGLKTQLVTSTDAKPNKYIIFLDRKPSLKLLAGLSQGYQAKFSYRSDVGYDVNVNLSPIHFNDSYSRYVRCVGNLLPFNYLDVRETTVYFKPNYYELTAYDRQILERVRLYVSVDASVKQVSIAGYSDNTGRPGVNNAVSELRAKSVADYLLSRGVPENKVVVNWYGMLDPADSNDNEIGRARNRRVVVKIKK